MRLAALLAALATLLLAATTSAQVAGDTPDPSITDGTAQRKLDAARDRWKAQGLRSYRFTVSVSCFCAPGTTAPHRMTVRHGKPQHPPAGFGDVATVPRLFRKVQRAIDGKVAGLSVRYGKRGMPRSISIDSSKLAVDDEIGYSARRLRPLG